MNPDIKNIAILLAGLFAAGAILIVIATLFRRVKKQSISELWFVYATEILIIAMVLIPAWAGDIYFLAALLLFSFFAHREIAYSTGLSFNPALSVAYVFSSLLLVAMFSGFLDLYLLQSVCLLAAIMAVLLMKYTGHGHGKAVCLLFIVILAASCLLYIVQQDNGFMLLLMLYLITETNDSFAYLTGKFFGTRKMFPVISPNKTIEGLAGGLLAALTAGMAFNYYLMQMSWLVLFHAVIAITGGAIAGDLVFSAYKRSMGIKDFRPLIKSQGGILDIYDSLLVASIVYYFLLL